MTVSHRVLSQCFVCLMLLAVAHQSAGRARLAVHAAAVGCPVEAIG